MKLGNQRVFSCTPGCCSFRAWILPFAGFAMACLIVFLSIGAIRAANNGKTVVQNVLSAKEKAAGWKLLFDGKTTSGWRGFRKSGFPTECWAITDGILKRVKQKDPNGEECGDIVTAQQYDNFEFQLDWKIEPGGNSGIKYLVVEDRPANWEQAYLDYHLLSLKKSGRTEPPDRLKPERWKYMSMSFELQLIDDMGNEDGRSSADRITGALYDLMAPTQRSVVSLTDFNTARVLVQGKHVEHWINGSKVVQFERESAELQKLIIASKFKHLDKFGTFAKGHIALQDHNSEVWFRNIKIRELNGH
jgi:3-keto-disaccharide hydrolase